MAPYHDRQVVLLPRALWRDWLSGAPETDLLKAGPAGTLAVGPGTGAPAALPLFGALP